METHQSHISTRDRRYTPVYSVRGKYRMIESLKKFVSNESGATAIEYALIASLVAVAIIGALTAMSGKLQNTFNEVASNVN